MPDLPKAVDPARLGTACPPLDAARYDAGSPAAPIASATTAPARRIDHVDGMTVEEAEHQLATRLYQNTAKVHFDQHAAGQGRFGRRLVYGGHVISLARALSFNGLANAFHVAAVNGGRHVAPLFAGDTVYAWSEVLATADLPGRARCRRAPPAPRRDEEPPLRRFPAQGRRGLRPGRDPGPRLLGPAAAVVASQEGASSLDAGRHSGERRRDTRIPGRKGRPCRNAILKISLRSSKEDGRGAVLPPGMTASRHAPRRLAAIPAGAPRAAAPRA